MPHVDGRKVAAAIKAMSPATPILLLTGWGQGMTQEETPQHVDGVLGKPPRLRDLRAALAAAAQSDEKISKTA
jgi:CheY-like chemotaxis protein